MTTGGSRRGIAVAEEKLYSIVVDTSSDCPDCPLKSKAMPPRDVADPSLIVDQPRKRKMASYVTNEDNGSADRMETIKRIKKTVGLTDASQASLEDNNEGAHPHQNITIANKGSAARIAKKHQSASKSVATVARTQKRKAQPIVDSSDEGETMDTDLEIIEETSEVEAEEDPEHQLGKSVQELHLDLSETYMERASR